MRKRFQTLSVQCRSFLCHSSQKKPLSHWKLIQTRKGNDLNCNQKSSSASEIGWNHERRTKMGIDRLSPGKIDVAARSTRSSSRSNDESQLRLLFQISNKKIVWWSIKVLVLNLWVKLFAFKIKLRYIFRNRVELTKENTSLCEEHVPKTTHIS